MASNEDSDDLRRLHSMGYAQELRRILGGFSNYALSLSIICILAGGITSFHVGFCAVGGAAAGFIWPAWTLVSLCVALAMGQVASAFPTAGGLYHWAAILGGRFWGYLVGWLNLAGLVTVLAAINVGTVRFAGTLAGTQAEHPLVQAAIVAAITLSQAAINHMGIRATRFLVDFSGWWIVGVSIAIVLVVAALAPSLSIGRVFTWSNLSGQPAEAPVWPASESVPWLALMAVLLPAYTITGFDASAHASEETIDAAREVPKAMVRSVVVSGIAGWIMLSIVAASIEDPRLVAEAGEGAFMRALELAAGRPASVAIGWAAVAAQYLCGLATVTAASRMAWAFARDGGLPWSTILAKVSKRTRAPAACVWLVATVSVLFTIWTPIYATIASICAILLYLSYVVPLVLAARALGREWTALGPFQMGAWFKPAAIVSAAGCAGLVVIGVQPPNDQAMFALAGLGAMLMACWWVVASKTFSGPPRIGAPDAGRLVVIRTREAAIKRGDPGP
ncbi:MAG: amino acid permease [Planctomycetota bacterium]